LINSNKDKGVIDMKAKIILITVIIMSVNVYGTNYLWRLDEGGDVINGPTVFSETVTGPLRLGVSDIGYIYFYGESYLICFDADLSIVNEVYGTGSYRIMALDNVRSEVLTDYTIRRFNATLGEYETVPVPDVTLSFTVDEYDGAIWWYPYTSDDDEKGLYKFARDGTQIYFFPEYEGYNGYSRVSPNGRFWTKIPNGSALINRDGSIQSIGPSVGYWKVIDPADESCWSYPFYSYGDSESYIAKINSAGSLVYYNSEDFNRPRGLDIDKTDGSVWIADTYNYDIVHLDQNGTELLRTDWDEELLAIAVDPTNDTIVVVSSPAHAVIEGTSIGKIKALFK
jgi:hypothetical protein